MNILDKKIGIIGGGQLGKMMIQEASKLDLYTVILDPTSDCPAHSLAHEHIVAAFDDEAAIRELANRVDVVTYEFEHIGVDILIKLENEGYIVYPTAKSLQIIQNKYTQKRTLQQAGIAVPDFIKVDSRDDMKEAGRLYGYPYLLKSCYGGYDGKGNRVVKDQADIDTAYQDLDGENSELMAETFIDFKCEISVIAGRDIKENITTFPIAENLHKDNILVKTTVPADISEEEEKKAKKMANQILKVFNGIGIFCTEMFVTRDGDVLLNEIAPRPHNSGHYTIEGCITSQFEQHIRAITGLPLGDTSLLRPVIMRNIIGDRGPEIAKYRGIVDALEIPGVNTHIYGKTMVKPGRKMGHITTIGHDLSSVDEKAEKASSLIGFE